MIQTTFYFEPPEYFITQLSNISDHVNFNVCTNRDDLKSRLPQTEVLITLFAWPDAEMFQLAPGLKWIQALTAGIDFLPLDDIKGRDIILTCGRGIHKIYMAEYAIAAMINLARNFRSLDLPILH